MSFNAERYQELLRKAIGSRSQKDFATIAGLSPFNLNRMLNDDLSNVSIPRKSTLRKIAEASEGRVTEAQMLDACGYVVQVVPVIAKSDDKTPEEKNFEIASRFKAGLERVAGSAMKYGSLQDFCDTVVLTDGVKLMGTKICSEEAFKGSGHLNAEYMAHCFTVWRYEGYDSCLYFTLFFCKTENGGVIVSDAVFDLDSLSELNHDRIGNFLFSVAEKGDVNYGDFPMVFSTKPHVNTDVELRLLKAIFGDDFSNNKENNYGSTSEVSGSEDEAENGRER